MALQGVVNSFRTSRGRLSLEEGTFTITGIQGVATGTEADALPDRPCHFEEAERPKIIRLHFVREEILAT